MKLTVQKVGIVAYKVGLQQYLKICPPTKVSHPKKPLNKEKQLNFLVCPPPSARHPSQLLLTHCVNQGSIPRGPAPGEAAACCCAATLLGCWALPGPGTENVLNVAFGHRNCQKNIFSVNAHLRDIS